MISVKIYITRRNIFRFYSKSTINIERRISNGKLLEESRLRLRKKHIKGRHYFKIFKIIMTFKIATLFNKTRSIEFSYI